MKIQLKFEDPLQVSILKEKDVLTLKILNPILLLSVDGDIFEDNYEMTKDVPP